MNVYEKVTIEISNICNAKCRWCTTGIKNRNCIEKADFMTHNEFEKGLNYLLEKQIIDQSTEVELYNWGEPFLNPDIYKIIGIINDKNMKYHLSTNASKSININEEYLDNLVYLTISLPGFSQESYDKIHKFKFEDILKNIEDTAEKFKKIDAVNKIIVNFHIYQFNIDEVEKACEFCSKLGVQFVPTFAYYNDFNLFNEFMERKMDVNDLYDSMEDLFCNFYNKIRINRPENYYCKEFDTIVFDHKFNLIQCCRLTTNEKIANLFDDNLDLQKIYDLRKELVWCKECQQTGQDYIIHNSNLYSKLINDYIKSNEKLTRVSNELEKYDYNLKIAIKEKEEFDANLKTAIKEKEEFDANLKIAINQRNEYRKKNDKLEEEITTIKRSKVYKIINVFKNR